MTLEFKLPDVGEGIAEGEIVKWLVAVGDTVAEHQPVVEVMTDKATVEVPSPRPGVIAELRAEEGEVVPVGSVIFVLDETSGGAPAETEESADVPAQAEESAGAPAQAEEPAGAPAQAEEPAPAPEPAAAAGDTQLIEFKLPDIGEGIAEGEIVRWIVAEGDVVKEHEAVVEVMTDKATVEVPAPAPGRVTKFLVEAGTVVPIGSVIFHLEASGVLVPTAAAPVAATSVAATPVEVATAQAPSTAEGGKVLAVPSARRVARELGVDLTQVSGSGRNGVVRRADVEAFFQSGGVGDVGVALTYQASRTPVVVPPGERESRVPFRGVRRKIAEAMVRSKFTATHFTVVEELDVTELVALRTKAKKVGADKGIKVTYMPFIMKACAVALQHHPELNATLDESTDELVTFHYVNLGIATDTKNGLMVPVIRAVETKGILDLASELGELAERTRAGKVKPDELQGGTFTITNAGNIGGILATPIINFPEVGIMGVHRIVKRPGVVERPDGDHIQVREYMNLSASVDHRLADGASAARFLVTMKEILEHPGLLAL